MTHEDMSLEDMVEDLEHPEWDPERELSMEIIDLLPEEPEHVTYHVEQHLESGLPLESPHRELVQPADGHYFHNPELTEVDKAIERVQEETPAEREARYRKDLEMLEVSGAIYRQKYEDKEHPVLPEIQWDL